MFGFVGFIGMLRKAGTTHAPLAIVIIWRIIKTIKALQERGSIQGGKYTLLVTVRGRGG